MKKVLSAFLALVFTLSTIQCMSVLSFSVGNSNYKPKSISSMSQAVPIETDKTYTESLSNRKQTAILMLYSVRMNTTATLSMTAGTSVFTKKVSKNL